MQLSAMEGLAVRQRLKIELPAFNGSAEEWPLFISQFEFTKDLCSPVENLIRLQKALKGDARKLVQNQLLNPTDVQGIVETLRMIYGPTN